MADLPNPIKDDFVDRDPERNYFKEMATGTQYTRIYCLKAVDQGGKSWLLQRMQLESKEAGWPSAYIDLGSKQGENAERLLKEAARQMGGAIQQALDQTVLPGPGVNIATGGGSLAVKESIVGGHQVTVNAYGSEKHLAVTVDDRHGYQVRVELLTRAFKAALAALPEQVCPALFLDQFDLANPDYVLPWLHSEFFTPLRLGEIKRPLFVLASRKDFDLFTAGEWDYAALRKDIPGLEEKFIRQYWLDIRQMPEIHLATILPLMAAYGGLPGKLSELAALIRQAQGASGASGNG